jgi:hypothetical protein
VSSRSLLGFYFSEKVSYPPCPVGALFLPPNSDRDVVGLGAGLGLICRPVCTDSSMISLRMGIGTGIGMGAFLLKG